MITWLFIIFRTINLILIWILIFYKRKEPALLLAWILLLIFLPPVGFVMYQLFERTPIPKKKTLFLNEYHEQKQTRTFSRSFNNSVASVIAFNEIYNGSKLYMFHDWMYFSNGKDKYKQLFADIEQATESIHLLYFIVREDEVGEKLIDLLTQKASQGVEVRLVYDSAGCFGTRLNYFKPIIEAGGHVYHFHPPTFRLIGLNYNYRNHRKIVVIDGRIGYLGGMNIGKEYMSLDPKYAPWRDGHIRLVGEAVADLQYRFIKDYLLVCEDDKDELHIKEQLNHYYKSSLVMTPCPIQIVSAGPDTPTDDIKMAFIKMMQVATTSIRIQTPYFIPDSLFLETLKIAAYSGVKVEVMIPTIADHHYVHRTTTSYIKELREANITVYLYEGFLHSKNLIIDDEICTVGSTNIDQRSFKINYEINAFIYDKELTDQVVYQFHKDVNNCRIVDETYEREKSLIIRIEEGIYRLISMLL